MARVAVVGGGVAGLACAAALRRDPRSRPADSRGSVESSDAMLAGNSVTFGMDTTAETPSLPGNWLAVPATQARNALENPSLQSTPIKHPALSFMMEHELISILRSEFEEGNLNGSVLIDGTPVNDIILDDDNSSSFPGMWKLQTNLGFKEVDFVVIADGAPSPSTKLIQMALENEFQELLPMTAFQNGLQYRGYTVFRGTSPDLHIREAFQTFGPGLRFAAVPLKSGSAWFAALSRPEASVKLHTDIATADDLEELKNRTHEWSLDWHNPIPQLVESTLSHMPILKTAAFSHTPHSNTLPVFGLCDSHRVSAIGDAAHTLDPILAQGAGVGIEDAFSLASVLTTLLQPKFQSKTFANPFNNGNFSTLADLEVLRSRRISTLHLISNLSQTVGHIDHPLLCRARDLYFHGIPQSVKGPIFNWMIKRSLSDSSLTSLSPQIISPGLKI